MHRIDGPGATAEEKFTQGDPAQAIPATVVTDDWLNSVQEELANVVEFTGEALDKAENDQLLLAIQQIIADTAPGIPLGQPFWHLGETPPVGAMFFASQELGRVEYAELWESLNDPDRNITFVTDAEYIAGRRGFWSLGDGVTTFRAPDPRALVLRVWDNGAGIDSGREGGSYQADALASHAHAVYQRVINDVLQSGSNTAQYINENTPQNLDRQTGETGEIETRMKNIAWPLVFNF